MIDMKEKIRTFREKLSMILSQLGARVKPIPKLEKPKVETFFSLSRDPEPKKGERNYLSDSYVKRFSHLLAAIRPPFVVGLEGEWGKGKTFFLTAIISQPVVEARYTIVSFDAWTAPDNEPLLRVLLNKVGVDLNIPRDQWFESVIRGGEAIASAAELPSIATPGIWTAIVLGVKWSFVRLVARWRKGSLERREALIHDLPKNFDNLVEGALKKQGKDSLLIFVDNLDRCLPSAALDLIERMRQIFNSKHCVIVVAYDLAIIDDAIKAKYGVNSKVSGRAYLEKLVDLPIKVPPAEPKDFIAMIAAHYARYTERAGATEAMTGALASLSKMGALFRAEFLANPRKWFRIIRQLALYMHLSGTETLHELLPSILLLLATREYHPELYKALRKNPRVATCLVPYRTGREWTTGTERHSAPQGALKAREEWFEQFGPLSLTTDDTAFEICLALGEHLNQQREPFARMVGANLSDAIGNLIKIMDGMSI